MNVSYLLASLVDFAVCRRAQWFIGFSLSSFSRILAELRALELQRGWYSACKSGLRFFTAVQLSVLHRNWSLCNRLCTSGRRELSEELWLDHCLRMNEYQCGADGGARVRATAACTPSLVNECPKKHEFLHTSSCTSRKKGTR